MSITPKWGDSYSPGEAGRTSWVPLDMTTVSAYPSSGQGKAAQLNYIVGMDSSVPGSSATVPSYVQIVGLSGEQATVTSSGLLNVRLVESVTVLSALEVDITGISGLRLSTEIEYPDTSIYATVGSILSNNVSSYNFGTKVQSVEVFNLSPNNVVYVSFNTSSLATLSSVGLPIVAEGYYAIDRECTSVHVGNPNSTSTDVRVIGHYRNA